MPRTQQRASDGLQDVESGERGDALQDSLGGKTWKDTVVQRRSLVVQREVAGEPSGGDVPIDNGGGSALSAQAQQQLSGTFNTDLSSVRVHTGSSAATALGAEAFTQGHHIHMASSTVNHDTLGHELGHVEQQSRGQVRANGSVGGHALNDAPALESQADAAGRAASQALSGPATAGSMGEGGGPSGGGPVQRRAAAPVIQRKLNMQAGYTEALNWSSEAVALIETYNEFESLYAQVAAVTSPNNRRMRRLKHFKTDIEAQVIPNDHAVRVQKTQEVEAEIAVAKALFKDVTGREAQAEEDDEIDDPDADGFDDVPYRSEQSFSGGGEEGSESVGGLVPSADDAAREQAEEGAPVALRLVVPDIELFKQQGRLGEAEGKAKAGGEVTQSGAKAEAGVGMSMVIGKKKEVTQTVVESTYARGRIKGEGTLGATMEGDLGVEGGYDFAEGQASAGLKGKAAAFAGGSFSVTPTVELTDSSGSKLAAGSATVGVSYGVGAEYEGEISMSNWRLVFKSKGKIAAGLGAEWGVALDLDLGALSSKAMG